jgi:hypothetical protein
LDLPEYRGPASGRRALDSAEVGQEGMQPSPKVKGAQGCDRIGGEIGLRRRDIEVGAQ